MIRKRTLAALLLASLALQSVAHAQAPNWAEVRIGVEANYPPFSMLGTDGKFSGFDIDIANAICADMKAKCTMVSQEWDGKIGRASCRERV